MRGGRRVALWVGVMVMAAIPAAPVLADYGVFHYLTWPPLQLGEQLGDNVAAYCVGDGAWHCQYIPGILWYPGSHFVMAWCYSLSCEFGNVQGARFTGNLKIEMLFSPCDAMADWGPCQEINCDIVAGELVYGCGYDPEPVSYPPQESAEVHFGCYARASVAGGPGPASGMSYCAVYDPA